MGLVGYLLSLIAVVILSVIIDLILPNGQINKYIKSIFSFIFIFVLLSPIPKLLNQDFSINSLFQGSSVELKTDYLENYKLQQAEKVGYSLEQLLKEEGFENVTIFVQPESEKLYFEIENLFVDLNNLVLNKNNEHIDKYATIKKLLIDNTGIREAQILFDG